VKKQNSKYTRFSIATGIFDWACEGTTGARARNAKRFGPAVAFRSRRTIRTALSSSPPESSLRAISLGGAPDISSI
jgi:hypothetical protein